MTLDRDSFSWSNLSPSPHALSAPSGPLRPVRSELSKLPAGPVQPEPPSRPDGVPHPPRPPVRPHHLVASSKPPAGGVQPGPSPLTVPPTPLLLGSKCQLPREWSPSLPRARSHCRGPHTYRHGPPRRKPTLADVTNIHIFPLTLLPVEKTAALKRQMPCPRSHGWVPRSRVTRKSSLDLASGKRWHCARQDWPWPVTVTLHGKRELRLQMERLLIS